MAFQLFAKIKFPTTIIYTNICELNLECLINIISEKVPVRIEECVVFLGLLSSFHKLYSNALKVLQYLFSVLSNIKIITIE